MKTTILPLRNLMNRSPLRSFLLIPFVLAWFALSPTARAVTPAPDGGYPGDNTAEGDNALFSLTDGIENTATGFEALYSTTTGTDNTPTAFPPPFTTPTPTHNTPKRHA